MVIGIWSHIVNVEREADQTSLRDLFCYWIEITTRSKSPDCRLVTCTSSSISPLYCTMAFTISQIETDPAIGV